MRKKDKTMEKMEIYTHEEIKDKYLGKIGTPKRDAYEANLQRRIQACYFGELVKEKRKSKRLTQEKLAEMLGVQKGQISKIEKGQNITLSTISRLLKALHINVRFGHDGDVSLT